MVKLTWRLNSYRAGRSCVIAQMHSSATLMQSVTWEMMMMMMSAQLKWQCDNDGNGVFFTKLMMLLMTMASWHIPTMTNSHHGGNTVMDMVGFCHQHISTIDDCLWRREVMEKMTMGMIVKMMTVKDISLGCREDHKPCSVTWKFSKWENIWFF